MAAIRVRLENGIACLFTQGIMTVFTQAWPARVHLSRGDLMSRKRRHMPENLSLRGPAAIEDRL